MTKQEVLTTLRFRQKSMNDYHFYVAVQKIIDSVEDGTFTDYEFISDIGLELHNEPTHNKLIEELEDGSKKITHFRDGARWVTREL